ncbi:uncharacterized protein DNG_10386 [Cephalotrichum gorgonifer]|uniref:Uncharacterized protein n=1 Tax=Cephalotrichum gorgonifer TaxID=2041049 RepID=A0AAE8N7J2_9PEZI|nr:uncharacterized protein DNG_10386 [Cephalotrichum gorgonifer]
MERPQKKARLGPAPQDESDDDDDDELNYEPEEISQQRDPGVRLAKSRATAAFRLKSTFESIFEKYERDFSNVGDEIDLRTGEIIVNNGHLQGMRNERDTGLGPEEDEEEGISLHDMEAVEMALEGTTGRGSSGGDEDEDQILQGRSSAVVRKGPGALVPRMPLGLSQRPRLTSHLGNPHNPPPFGASPLFFGSWGPPGAMDPAWQAPQIHIPQFKSSFAADLFADRYRLPARESSRSIWAPGSHDDEDEDVPVPRPRPRLAPPTRKVPARPRATKLIHAPPPDAGDSGDEDSILMGTNTLLFLNNEASPSRRQQETTKTTDDAGIPPSTAEEEMGRDKEDREVSDNTGTNGEEDDTQVEVSGQSVDSVALPEDDSRLPRLPSPTCVLPARRKPSRASDQGPGDVPVAEYPRVPVVIEDRQSGAAIAAPPGSRRETSSRGAPTTGDAAVAAPIPAPSPPDTVSPVQMNMAGEPGQRGIMRGKSKEKTAGNAAPSSHLPLASASLEPTFSAASSHQLSESQDHIKATPRRTPHGKSALASTPGARPNPATPSRTPRHKLTLPGTPTSVPSTGHRSLISLLPERETPDGSDSEDELTSSTLWALFQKSTPAPDSITKSSRRRRQLEASPTKFKRSSAVRLSFGFKAERPSAPDGSVMRTPGGTIRKCGERGLKCGKDFCFTCC